MNHRKFQRIKKKVHDYLFDHVALKLTLEWGSALIVCAVSALIYAFGFSTFAKGVGTDMSIITGGVSGIAQSLRMLVLLFVGPDSKIVDGVMFESVMYTLINVPLIIFAFRKVGWRFSVLTMINVLLTSLFMPIIKESGAIQGIATNDFIREQPFTRALFAGVCTGASAALAFKGFFSTGGLDIISYYISNKKGVGTGKYSGLLNVINIMIHTLLFIIAIQTYPETFTNGWTESLVSFLYGLVYLVAVIIVIDIINVRNKKVQVQIVTQNECLSDILIANLPHSVTISKAVGGFSKTERFILTMTISSFELNRVVNIVKKADPNAFVQAITLQQVYGKFYMTPIK